MSRLRAGQETTKGIRSESALLSGNKFVVDVLEQCVSIGELHHALDAGVMKSNDVYGELGEVVAGNQIRPHFIRRDHHF